MSAVNSSLSRELELSLLSILQRGLTEARTYALAKDESRTSDLLDALDNIPRHLADWNDDSEAEIRLQLATFQEQSPRHPTDYVAILDRRENLLTPQ